MIRRTTSPAIRRVTGTLAALAIAALLATGCDAGGSDDDSRSSGDTADDPTPTIRTVDAPEESEDLTEALEDTATTLTDAGCTFGSYDIGDDVTHVDEGDDLDSASFPPVGGNHYGDWAPFGRYDETIDDGFAVHNMEHGGVVVWLGTKVDEATTEAVAELLDDGEKWVVAPRRDIEGLFSGAWGVGLSCPPEALEQLGPEATADALDDWYEVVESTGSPAEKDVPPYAGAMKEPTPERDISEDSPF